MSQRTLLITDFFSKCRSTTVSNAVLFEKPIKVIKVEEQSVTKQELLETDLDQCTPNLSSETNSPIQICKNSFANIFNISFVYNMI